MLRPDVIAECRTAAEEVFRLLRGRTMERPTELYARDLARVSAAWAWSCDGRDISVTLAERMLEAAYLARCVGHRLADRAA